jgi:hypothetical protein
VVEINHSPGKFNACNSLILQVNASGRPIAFYWRHGANQVDIIMAVAGALSIYLGYRLFCDSTYPGSRVRHLVSGALLAVFGLGMLIADVRNIRAAGPDSHAARHKSKSTKEGSFETPKADKSGNAPEQLV